MLRGIEDGGPVRGPLVTDQQSVPLREGVGDREFHPTGVPLLPVRADQPERDRRPVRVLDHRPCPEGLVEAAPSTVQVIRAVVCRELDDRAVERKAPPRDAVAVASDDGAQVVGAALIAFGRIVAEHHVRHVPFPVGHQDPRDHRAVVDDLDDGARAVLERVFRHAPPVGKAPERVRCNGEVPGMFRCHRGAILSAVAAGGRQQENQRKTKNPWSVHGSCSHYDF